MTGGPCGSRDGSCDPLSDAGTSLATREHPDVPLVLPPAGRQPPHTKRGVGRGILSAPSEALRLDMIEARTFRGGTAPCGRRPVPLTPRR